MQVVERSAIVTFTAAQMFALVNDVARYPEFLPWCTGSRIEEVNATERLATVNVSRGLLRTEFTTRNTLHPDTQILMHLVAGPFRDLTGEWRFDAIGERGARVHFRLEFEFKNRLLATSFNAVFEALCGSIVEAFVLRAQKIYALRMALTTRSIDVEVVYAEPARAVRRTYQVHAAATIADVMGLAAADPAFAGVDLAAAAVGVFGKLAAPGQVLQAGDRVEVYRPLAEDPKDARRERARNARKQR